MTQGFKSGLFMGHSFFSSRFFRQAFFHFLASLCKREPLFTRYYHVLPDPDKNQLVGDILTYLIDLPVNPEILPHLLAKKMHLSGSQFWLFQDYLLFV
jgi:hypothetical protein